MDAYFATLLREHSVTTVTIVRDDAATNGLETRKTEFSRDLNDVPNHKSNKWHQPFSFQNNPDFISAPTLPARRVSNDSLYSLPEEEHVHKQRGFFSQKLQGVKKRGSWQKKCDTVQEDTNSESYEQKTEKLKENGGGLKKKRSSWDDLKKMLKSMEAPSLPIRKKSDCNLLHQSPESKKNKGFRSNSLDRLMPPSNNKGLRKGGLLDNSVMMVKGDHFERGVERQLSLDDALLLSDRFMRDSSEPKSSTGNGASLVTNRRQLLNQRSGSLNNAFLSAQNGVKLPESYMKRKQDFLDKQGNQEESAPTLIGDAPKPERNIKQIILERLNSPKWQSRRARFQIPTDLFELPSVDNDTDVTMAKELAEDVRFGRETRTAAPLLPHRKPSDMHLSLSLANEELGTV